MNSESILKLEAIEIVRMTEVKIYHIECYRLHEITPIVGTDLLQ